MADDNVIRPPQFNEAAEILKAVPEDLRETYDYITDKDSGLCNDQMFDDARMIARKCTLGQALVELKKQRPDIKAYIRMPVPRQRPWRELPALMIGERTPPGIYIRLDDHERANLLVLLKACGYRTNGIEPFTFLRRGVWLGRLGDKIEGDGRFDPHVTEEPEVTYEELEKCVREWKKGGGKTRPPGW